MRFSPPPELPPLAPPGPPYPLDTVVTTMPNGLSVWSARLTAVPLASVRLVVRGGRSFDTPDRPGFANLLAAALREGTVSRTGEALSALSQSAGADLVTTAGDDVIAVAATGLASRLDVLLDVVADVARNPAFRARDVERVKSLALEELATNEADPAFVAGRAFRRAVYGSHPYAVVSPTASSIQDTTPEMLRTGALHRLLPPRALLLVVGDVGDAAVADGAERFFGDWQGSDAPLPEPEPARASPAPPRSIVLLDRPGSVQTNLNVGGLGLTRRDPDAFALHLAATIYGGAFSSRLVANLREEKGYTYSPETSARWSPWRGLVRTGAAVRNEVTGAALNEILYERNRMVTTDVTNEELERARSRELGAEILSFQTSAGLAGELADLWLNGLPPAELPRVAEALRSISRSDVRRVSRRFFGEKGVRIVAVGDAAAIRGELECFGEVDVLSAVAMPPSPVKSGPGASRRLLDEDRGA